MNRLIDTWPEHMSHSSWFRRVFFVHSYCEAENSLKSEIYERELEAWEAGRNGEKPPIPPGYELSPRP